MEDWKRFFHRKDKPKEGLPGVDLSVPNSYENNWPTSPEALKDTGQLKLGEGLTDGKPPVSRPVQEENKNVQIDTESPEEKRARVTREIREANEKIYQNRRKARLP